MKYVQINSVSNGSTGAVMRRTHEERIAAGDESWMIWGRGREAENHRECNFGSKVEFYLDVLQTRLDGKAGFHSEAATKRLLTKLDEIDPDVVHLHNIHGYYLNIEMLFNWLARRKQKTFWTLHDCWAFTGHCAYFTFADCQQWRTGCAYKVSCPQISEYPKTISKKSCSWNYAKKEKLFSIQSNLTLITPSNWLAGLIAYSSLAKCPIEVRHNTIDTSVYNHKSNDFKERHGLSEKIMVLGVANPWSPRKGLNDILWLERRLGDAYAIVLVGLSKTQIKEMPERILALGRTESSKELANIYSAADVFINPTHEDNFPTVNLEAQACGTFVITYSAGGAAETIVEGKGLAVDSAEQMLHALKNIADFNTERAGYAFS